MLQNNLGIESENNMSSMESQKPEGIKSGD